MSETLLDVRHLKKYFRVPGGTLHAVDDVSFRLDRGKVLGVVGESGCGKSTLGRTILGLLDATDGQVVYDGEDFTHAKGAKGYDTGCQIDSPPSFGGPICPVEKGQDPATWRERIMEHLEYEQSRGNAKICQTLDEAAEFIGCDPAVLKDTVARYNTYCARGYDEEFLKGEQYLEPVTQPPYYVILGRSGIDTCLGGLKIDNHQRVMDLEGHAIPGLYAAGVMCSGWFNDSYCYFGSEMSFTIYSGRTSGAEAAAYLQS